MQLYKCQVLHKEPKYGISPKRYMSDKDSGMFNDVPFFDVTFPLKRGKKSAKSFI